MSWYREVDKGNRIGSCLGTLLLAFVGPAGVAQAGVIGYAGAVSIEGFVEGQNFASSGIPDMSFTYAVASTSGGGLYFLTGEFCFEGWCAGQAQQTGLLAYPLALRLTALTLTCQSGGLDCDPLTLLFNATVDGLDTINATPVFADVALAGNHTASTPISGSVFGNFSGATASYLFSTPVNPGAFSFTQQTQRRLDLGPTVFGQLGLHLDGLPSGASFVLPNSLEIAQQSSVPEPASAWFGATGVLFLLGLIRRPASAA